jgi:hypothetical protein
MNPFKRLRPRTMPVWVWFVGEGIWRRMRIQEKDAARIGSPTALITVESDEFLPMPIPGWRVTQQRPGEVHPYIGRPVGFGDTNP